MKLTPEIAKMILKPICESGTPPLYGLEHFSVGFENVFETLEASYLKDIIKNNGASFKFISVAFGNGKTHFTYQFREIAWKNNYATSYVLLSPAETQFHKLLSVFVAICQKLEKPLDESEVVEILDGKKRVQTGLMYVFKSWFQKKKAEFEKVDSSTAQEKLLEFAGTLTDFDNIYFGRAMRILFTSLLEKDLEKAEEIKVWLDGNYDNSTHKKLGLKKIEDKDAFSLIKSLASLLIDQMGYSGLVIFFDEGERHALTTKNKDIQISNLRQVIDKIGRAHV